MVKPKNSSDFQRCLVRIARYADLLSLGISLNPSDSESDATKVRNGTLFTHDFFALKFQKLNHSNDKAFKQRQPIVQTMYLNL